MKKALIGALLSGFIFPGMGQFYLKNRLMGLGLIVAANLGLAGFVASLVLRIMPILQEIEPQLDVNTDVHQLANQVAQQIHMGSGSFLETISLLLLLASWIFSIIHAFVAGRKMAMHQDHSD